MIGKNIKSLKQIKSWAQKEIPGLFEFNGQRRAVYFCQSLYPYALEGTHKKPIPGQMLYALYTASILFRKVPGYKKLWLRVKEWRKNLHEISGIFEQIYLAMNVYRILSISKEPKISLSKKYCGDIYVEGSFCVELKKIETMHRKDQQKIQGGRDFSFIPKIYNKHIIQEKISEAASEMKEVSEREIKLLLLNSPYLPKQPNLNDLDALIVYHYKNARNLSDLFTHMMHAECTIFCKSSKLVKRIRPILNLLWSNRVSIVASPMYKPPYTLKSAPGKR